MYVFWGCCYVSIAVVMFYNALCLLFVCYGSAVCFCNVFVLFYRVFFCGISIVCV